VIRKTAGYAHPLASEEQAIRVRLNSAARSRVADYGPEAARQLLDDARTLRGILDDERRHSIYPLTGPAWACFLVRMLGVSARVPGGNHPHNPPRLTCGRRWRWRLRLARRLGVRAG
jgi:hypothetical protein